MKFVKEMVQKTKLVVTKPRIFFEGIKKEEGIKTALLYYIALSFLSLVLEALSIVLLQGVKSLNIVSLIVGYVVIILGSFIIIAIIHVWAKIFGGAGNFGKTYQLYVYSNTPKALLSFVPVIGPLVGSIYAFVIFVIGGAILHKFSMKKSILVFGVPAIVVVVLTTVLAFVALLPTLLMGAANAR